MPHGTVIILRLALRGRLDAGGGAPFQHQLAADEEAIERAHDRIDHHEGRVGNEDDTQGDLGVRGPYIRPDGIEVCARHDIRRARQKARDQRQCRRNEEREDQRICQISAPSGDMKYQPRTEAKNQAIGSANGAGCPPSSSDQAPSHRASGQGYREATASHHAPSDADATLPPRSGWGSLQPVSTSVTSAQRAKDPSRRSWLSTAFSSMRPRRAVSKASTS